MSRMAQKTIPEDVRKNISYLEGVSVTDSVLIFENTSTRSVYKIANPFLHDTSGGRTIALYNPKGAKLNDDKLMQQSATNVQMITPTEFYQREGEAALDKACQTVRKIEGKKS